MTRKRDCTNPRELGAIGAQLPIGVFQVKNIDLTSALQTTLVAKFRQKLRFQADKCSVERFKHLA